MRIDKYVCDRCGKDIPSSHRTISFTHPDSNVSVRSDLCDDCVEKLIRFMEGGELNESNDNNSKSKL